MAENWSTENEKTYIDGLVTGKWFKENKSKLSSDELLENYIRSARRRIKWETFGTVDGEAVIRHAEKYAQ